MSSEKTKKQKIAEAQIADIKSQPGLKKYPCKKNKGEHGWFLKIQKRFFECHSKDKFKGKFSRCIMGGIREDEPCPPDFEKMIWIWEEWRIEQEKIKQEIKKIEPTEPEKRKWNVYGC